MQFYFLQERNINQRATKNQVCMRAGYRLCLQLAYLYWSTAASNASLLVFLGASSSGSKQRVISVLTPQLARLYHASICFFFGFNKDKQEKG